MKYVKKFCLNGLMFGGLGPLIYAIVFIGLGFSGVVDTITREELVLGIFTSYLMAFIASGIGVLYEIEKLPLLFSTLLHMIILYVDYIVIYLINGWIKNDSLSIIIFTSIFFGGYIIIWCLVYFLLKYHLKKINSRLSN